ncbi:hypothetical protein OS493_021655 [Desmophyllum pertusum]|uniref:Uncharacterized protein n=1 Tax=Desmophyllum pertusum TaxID=174260 RepID=A0A9X0CDS4_9CNID|nr:hypothetical protein OS493_021655 [Desmophyllum pertusum]
MEYFDETRERTALSFGVLFPVLMEYFDETRERTGPLLQVLLDAVEWRNTFRITVALYVLVCILSLTFNPHVEEIT